MKYRSLLGLMALCVTMACEKDEVEKQTPLKAETVKDLPANPADIPSGNRFTFFSFKDGIIANADSATAKWDIGFRSTGIIVNGGISGPGKTTAAVTSGIFAEMKAAPADATFKTDGSDGLAIPAGSGKGWYTYNSATHEISPIAGKVIFVKTSEGNYAKFEILSYYKGAPVAYDSKNVGRYYTFRYVFQPNKTASF